MLGREQSELEALGALATAREIAQQPQSLRRTHAVLQARKDELARFLSPLLMRARMRLILTGAGSSALVGQCLAPYLSATLPCRVEAIATTDLVSTPTIYFKPELPTLLVSFARSGESPESFAAVQFADDLVGDIHHLAVSCNGEGRLVRQLANAGNALAIVLPEETNDRAFAMTSSVSSMAYAALASLSDLDPARLERIVRAVAAVIAGQAETMTLLAAKEHARVIYLGSGMFKALAREAALKLLELTDGAVVVLSDSGLGFRHGPKAIIDDATLVVMFFSNDAYTRRYDLDLLEELHREARASLLAICGRAEGLPAEVDRIAVGGTAQAADVELLFPFLAAAQMLAFESSLRCGLSPDQPNRSGTVHRVVRGVRIHPLRGESEPASAQRFRARRTTRPLYLGVDGGGTKTSFVLIDADGKRLAEYAGPAAYHPEIGIYGLREVLRRGLAALFGAAGADASALTHAFFGIPAYGEDNTLQARLDAMPESLLGHRRYACGNDVVCAWAGALAGADGITIVAGTGSIAYGERNAVSARAGGWGELFGDEGSAYWIATRGLNAFTRMSEGRLPKGPLYDTVRRAFRVADDLDVCAKLMQEGGRADVAALAKLIADAAHQGDHESVRIFEEAARELAQIIHAVRRRLPFAADEEIPVSHSGGVFNAGALILTPLSRQLENLSARYRPTSPRFSPAIGAALHAARLAGQPLSAAALSRLVDGERA